MATVPSPTIERNGGGKGAGGWRVAAAFAALIAVWGAGLAIGGEVGQVMAAGAMLLPLMLLSVLAYLGAEREWARVLAVLWLLALLAAAILGSLFTSMDALGVGAMALPEGAAEPDPWADPRLADVLLGCGAAALIGLAGFLPGVRRALARRLPLDPDSFVHAVALVAVVALTLIALVPLLVLSAPPLLAIPDLPAEGEGLAAGRDAAGRLRDDLYALVWTIPAAVVGVGFGLRRGLSEALARLGLVRPSLRQVVVGLALGAVLLAAADLLDVATRELWGAAGWPLTDEEGVARLMAYTMSPLGALVIGVSAGLGEELGVRGVLQPRLGLLLSNLFFTSLHAFQYNWDGLLAVFLSGLVMGLVRQRSNTTTSAVVHGSYDFYAILGELLQVPPLFG